MLAIPHPDIHNLNAAIGWLELGNALEANQELERIKPKHRMHPDVLSVRWGIYARLEKWDLAFKVAHSFTQLAPGQSQAWNFLSISHYRLGRTQMAWDCLAAVATKFSSDWLTAYNMACYAAQLGNLEAAEMLIHKAIGLGDEDHIRSTAVNDPDLEPIRQKLKLSAKEKSRSFPSD